MFQRPKRGRPSTQPVPPERRTTSISLSAEDLAAVGRLLAIGQAVTGQRPAVLARLKAAMTRLGVPVPPGL